MKTAHVRLPCRIFWLAGILGAICLVRVARLPMLLEREPGIEVSLDYIQLVVRSVLVPMVEAVRLLLPPCEGSEVRRWRRRRFWWL